MAVFWVVAPCSLVEVYCVSELPAAYSIRAISTSKTSIIFYDTRWRNNPKDDHLRTRRRGKLVSHDIVAVYSENDAKLINTLSAQYITFKQVMHVVNTVL
jgi:hypothetical protein